MVGEGILKSIVAERKVLVVWLDGVECVKGEQKEALGVSVWLELMKGELLSVDIHNNDIVENVAVKTAQSRIQIGIEVLRPYDITTRFDNALVDE